jgi:hypothetical protein
VLSEKKILNETIKKSVVSKIKSQREKRIVYQQMNLLPQYVTNPELLLKKKIKHKLQLNPPSSYHLANSWNTIHPHSCQHNVFHILFNFRGDNENITQSE